MRGAQRLFAQPDADVSEHRKVNIFPSPSRLRVLRVTCKANPIRLLTRKQQTAQYLLLLEPHHSLRKATARATTGTTRGTRQERRQERQHVSHH